MRPKVVANCTKALSKGGAGRGIRLGAREPKQFRNVRVEFGKSYGHCEVVFEPGTKVYSQVSATVGEPADSRPGEGSFTVSVWVSPAATGEMIGNSQRPALIARAIERLFKDNRAIDLESLCIRVGEKAWILRADIHIIDMNGCLQEAAALAVLGSLLTFRRPNAYIDRETEELVVEQMDTSIPVKLHLFHLPILTSFALCNDILLAEPIYEEEEIFSGKLVIGLNDSKELCYLHTTNEMSEGVLLDATQLAQEHCIKRANYMKELAAKYIEKTEIPVHQRIPGPRNTGAVFSLSAAENELPSLKDLSRNIHSKQSSTSGKIKLEQRQCEGAGKSVKSVPTIETFKIKVLDEINLLSFSASEM